MFVNCINMSNQNNAYQTVELVPTNGSQFTVSKGKRVIFEIPPDLGFIKGRDCVLQLDILNTAVTKQMANLNNLAGGSSIINRIDVYSLGSGTHLSTCENYNEWCAIENQYFYDDQSNLTALEGCGQQVFARDSTGVVTQHAGDVAANALSPRKKDGSPVYGFRRYTCPLRLPIFRWFDEERLLPVQAMNGLRLEIMLESSQVALQGVMAEVLNPAVAGASVSYSDPFATALVCNPVDSATADIVLRDVSSVKKSALAVGNAVTVTTTTTPAGEARAILSMSESSAAAAQPCDTVGTASIARLTTTAVFADAAAFTPAGLIVGNPVKVDVPASAAVAEPMDAITGDATVIETTEATLTAITAVPFVVGDVMKITVNGEASVTRTITALAMKTPPAGPSKVLVTLDSTLVKGAGTGAIEEFERQARSFVTTIKAVALSAGAGSKCECSFTDGALVPKAAAACVLTPIAGCKITLSAALTGASNASVDLKLSSDERACDVRPNLKIVSVNVPNPRIKLPFNYQFTGWDLFVNTLPQSSLKHQQDINSVQSKARCMNSIYIDANKESDRTNSSYFTGSPPSDLNLRSIQYFINNRLYPVQSYDPNVKAERVVNENENVKALRVINKEPKNLGDNKGGNLDVYTNSYIHSRELARQKYVYDLREAEPQIRTEYSGARANNFTINTFVWSQRIINVDDKEGIRVVL